MADSWQSWPNAPRPGTFICRSQEIPAGSSRGFDVAGFPVLLVRVQTRLYGYVNACPHQFLPLDYRKTDVLSADRMQLICSNHQACFDAKSGQGIAGFGLGCALDSLPVAENGTGDVIVTEETD
jgi:nitrite reductase/ring-hydroxylating ferredoxin subunit